MLRSVSVENFFSFGEGSLPIELNPSINILLGINGSGKTNFLRAIRLLYESVAGEGEGFEKMFTRWGGFQGVANYSGKKKMFIRLRFEFDHEAIARTLPQPQYNFRQNPIYQIIIRPLGSTGYFLEETASVGEFIFMKIENGKGLISARNPDTGKIKLESQSDLSIGNGNESPSFKTPELVLRQFEDPVRFLPLYTLKRAIESLVIYDYFNTSPQSPVRAPVQSANATRLSSDGSNLTSLLNSLQHNHSLAYETLIQQITRINPYFKNISFSNQGSYLHLALREQNLDRSIPIEHISDGTLRYLMLLVIALNPESGYVLGIDEPENGLHPDMLNTITTLLKDAARRDVQLLIATHSPLVLNAFELEDLLIFSKNERNETIVERLDEDDLDEYLSQYTLGQIWLMGKIGAKRW